MGGRGSSLSPKKKPHQKQTFEKVSNKEAELFSSRMNCGVGFFDVYRICERCKYRNIDKRWLATPAINECK